MSRLRNKLIYRGQETFIAYPNQFNTLIHDDFWTNNILLKYLDGSGSSRIENVTVIDWLHACWTSPVIDLHYLFNTSLHESLRPGAFEDLIAIYHGHLMTFLIRLEYQKNIPTLDEFQKQFKDKVFFGSFRCHSESCFLRI